MFKEKVTVEERIEAARTCADGRMSQAEAARRLGVDKSTVREWVRRYKAGGALAFKEQEHNTVYTEEMKVAADGETAIKYSVSYQQVYTWVKKFRKLGEAGLEDRRGKRIAAQEPRTELEEMKIKMAQLEHENYMLRMERDLLKKLDELERRDAFRK